jgi:TRAP-type mannitol/chloroaromatic compound transport system permease large subunit
VTSLFFVLALTLLALLGAPLFAVILAVAMAGFWTVGVDLSVIAIELYRLADTPALVALPLFTFAGYLLGESQTSRRLVRLTRALLGCGGLCYLRLFHGLYGRLGGDHRRPGRTALPGFKTGRLW